MIRQLSIVALSLVCCQARCAEPDSIGVLERLSQRELPVAQVFTAQFANPANMLYRYQSALSGVTLGYSNDEATQAVVAENGTGVKGFGVDLDTYVRLSPSSRVWGGATYSNRTRMDVFGCEVSDFDIISPYAMADTIGGDMKGEVYTFLGGYAARTGEWSWGVDLSYRALSEYRDSDPRPRNISHLLNITAGFNRRLGARYMVGLSLTGGRYKQNSSVTFYNELGGKKMYHLTGLGTSYFRFDGSRYEARYADWRYGASFQLLPAGSGFTATVEYTRRKLTKELPSNADITINGFTEECLSAEVAFKQRTWGAGLFGSVNRRKGFENMFGTSSGDIYEFISRSEQWKRDECIAGAAGYVTLPVGNVTLSAVPEVTFGRYRESYALPAMWRDADNISGALSIKGLWLNGNNLFRFSAEASFKTGFNQDLQVQAQASPYFHALLVHDFEMQSGNVRRAGINASWSRQITSRYAMTVGCGAALTSLPLGAHGHMLHLTLGFAL